MLEITPLVLCGLSPHELLLRTLSVAILASVSPENVSDLDEPLELLFKFEQLGFASVERTHPDRQEVLIGLDDRLNLGPRQTSGSAKLSKLAKTILLSLNEELTVSPDLDSEPLQFFFGLDPLSLGEIEEEADLFRAQLHSSTSIAPSQSSFDLGDDDRQSPTEHPPVLSRRPGD